MNDSPVKETSNWISYRLSLLLRVLFFTTATNFSFRRVLVVHLLQDVGGRLVRAVEDDVELLALLHLLQ